MTVQKNSMLRILLSYLLFYQDVSYYFFKYDTSLFGPSYYFKKKDDDFLNSMIISNDIIRE